MVDAGLVDSIVFESTRDLFGIDISSAFPIVLKTVRPPSRLPVKLTILTSSFFNIPAQRLYLQTIHLRLPCLRQRPQSSRPTTMQLTESVVRV